MSVLVRDDRVRPGTVGRTGNFAGFGPGWVTGTTVPTPGQDYAMSADGVAALQVAAVVACVGLRSGAFAQIPLKGYTGPSGAGQLLDPQPTLYADPSDVLAGSAWRVQMSISRDLWGWAFGPITARDAALYPTKVEWLDPSIVQPKVIAGNQLEWRVNGQVVDASQYMHIPSRWVLPGAPQGIAPLAYSGLVDLARTAQNFGRDWFRNGAVPSAIVYSDDPKLTSTQAESMVDRLIERWRNRRPAVLSKNFRYEKVSVAANESQFLETCTKIAADIASSFNLPPARIGAAISGQAVTYQNIDQSQQQVMVDSINPDLVVVQETIDRYTPRDQFSRWSTGAFLRSDLMTRYRAHEIGIRAGFELPDEARAIEDWPPLPNGLGQVFPSMRPTGPNDINANPDGMTGGDQ